MHKCYVTKQNKAYRQRLFFGLDQYTSDSDIVCILQHTGVLAVPDEELTHDSTYEAFSAVFKVLKPRSNYSSALRHHIKSRKLGQYEGHTLKLESVVKLDWIGSDEELL